MVKAKVVVVGGGFSGCAAAIAATKAGVQATLLERADMLSGAGLRACHMNYNGRLVIAEEAKALGGGEVFEALESIMLHRGNIIDSEHGYFYNATLIDPTMREIVETARVELHLEARVVEVEKDDGLLKVVILDSGEKFLGDAFIDCTGSFGGMNNCIRYGHGCVMCIHRCPIFGDRVSIATKAGAEELMWRRPDGTPGRLSPSVILYKESLKPELRARLEKEGAFSIPLPKELIDYSKEDHFRGIRGRHQIEHINLADIGLGAKCLGIGYFSLADFRKIPGFETAQIEHPMGGGRFNFINHLSVAPRDNSLRAKGFTNLFVAGEKAGHGGIAEAINTGVLAGHNAARKALGQQPVELPRSTVIGDFIAFIGEKMETVEGLSQGYSTGHGVYFERMKELGFYTTDPAVIHKRIRDLGLAGILAQRLA